ncbi:MAG: helix-turn-helix domain-containing protein [Dehalococcoidia bacterium]|nr:helix-turn-helix domain-containing protein [Dehalococcoidia bacterium]|tara:strand:- start:87 stop:728 length:642 start_codon:yes stop_codon:yes gene_type:complete
MIDKIETPGDRLLTAITISQMTQRKFAGLIGMSPNGLNSIVKGKKRLSRILALATEQITRVRAEWILNNENPMFLDPNSKIDPWDRIVLEFYRSNDMDLFERILRKIDQETSPFRNSIDPKKAWSKEQNDKYQALIDEAKDLVNYFIHLEAEDGQGPYRLGLMILHGGFPEIELVNSSAAYYTETGNNSYMERISEIRLELDDLINNPNTKGD